MLSEVLDGGRCLVDGDWSLLSGYCMPYGRRCLTQS